MHPHHGCGAPGIEQQKQPLVLQMSSMGERLQSSVIYSLIELLNYLAEDVSRTRDLQ